MIVHFNPEVCVLVKDTSAVIGRKEMCFAYDAGIEHRAWYLQGKLFIAELHPTPSFF